jgi:hypothetical protein
VRRIALGLVALVLCGSCGSRVRNWDEQLAAQQQGVAAPTTVGRITTTTAQRSSGGHTSGRGSARPTPTLKSVANTGPLPSPKPGRYVYDESSNTTDEDGNPQRETSVSFETWRVTKASADEVLTSVQARAADAEDGEATRTTRFRTTGTQHLALTNVDDYGDDDTSSCDFTPPLVTLTLPLRVGSTWKATSTCKDNEGISQTFKVEARVTGEADDVVGGTRVHTFVISSTDSLTQTFDDEASTDPTADFEPVTIGYDVKRTAHVDPNTLLVVTEDQEIRPTFEDAGDLDPIKIHRQLRSLAPAL